MSLWASRVPDEQRWPPPTGPAGKTGYSYAIVVSVTVKNSAVCSKVLSTNDSHSGSLDLKISNDNLHTSKFGQENRIQKHHKLLKNVMSLAWRWQNIWSDSINFTNKLYCWPLLSCSKGISLCKHRINFTYQILCERKHWPAFNREKM